MSIEMMLFPMPHSCTLLLRARVLRLIVMNNKVFSGTILHAVCAKYVEKHEYTEYHTVSMWVSVAIISVDELSLLFDWLR